MGLLVLLIVVIAAVGAYLWYRSKMTAHPAAAPKQTASSYHAVTIRYHKDACLAVRELDGKKFLSNKAPRLPVQGCTMQNCGCKYVHYDDRRTEGRRAALGAYKFSGVQQRARPDRRRA